MDIKSVERFILLDFDERVDGKTDKIEKKLLSSGIRRYVFAVLVLSLWLMVLADNINDGFRLFPLTFGEIINPLPFILVAALAPVFANYRIRKSNRRIEEISRGINTVNVEKKVSVIGYCAFLLALGFFRWLDEQFPITIQIFGAVAFGCFTLYFLMRSLDKFYKIHLIKVYCPYLITPADKRYNDDLFSKGPFFRI